MLSNFETSCGDGCTRQVHASPISTYGILLHWGTKGCPGNAFLLW